MTSIETDIGIVSNILNDIEIDASRAFGRRRPFTGTEAEDFLESLLASLNAAHNKIRDIALKVNRLQRSGGTY